MTAAEEPPEREAQTAAVTQRIHRLKPSDLAEHVRAAVEALGGEAQRVEIIDRALAIGGWSEDEKAVVSWYTGAARKYHLRSLADYAVTVCRDRGELIEGDSRGRWRLAGLNPTRPHRHGRVFTGGVGVAGGPVPADWAAREQTHLWFSQQSQQLGRGDHLFVLGAGRGSAVLGLFETTSAGMSRTPRNSFDPERWPWAISVRALASVPPNDAVSVPDVTAPRATAQPIRDPQQRAALYSAVEGYAVDLAPSEEARSSTLVPEDRGAVRRARPFDPGHAPTPARARDALLDVEEALARQEKGRQGHHVLLVHLHAALAEAEWRDLEEIPAAIDLRGVRPSGDRVIFEAKTISDSNETSQCRSAVAQLLEYRLEYGRPDDRLCIVVDAVLSPRRAEVLERLGIGVLTVQGDALSEDITSVQW